MKKNTFISITSYVFLAVAIVHLLRVINQWPFVVSETAIPMWVSWAAFLGIGYLAWSGFNFGKK